MRRSLARIGLLLCLTAGWGCGPRAAVSVTPPPPPATDAAATAPEPEDDAADCRLIPPASEPGEPVALVALTEPVDPAHAPHPANESERLLFRQVYEGLIRVDCDGRARPALAGSWRLEAGRTWLVSLREDARFADGAPVTPQDVLAAWTIDGASPPWRTPVLRLIESAAVVDDRTLAITLRTPDSAAPLPLAHADLAIAKQAPDAAWPVGTRAVVRTDGDAVTLDDAAGEGATMRFLLAAGRDERDLLDEGGVDLLVTSDPQVLDYAATLPRFALAPLAWRRMHVLLAPGRTAAAPALSADARQALAEDAVRGEARGAQDPFWWQSPGCELSWSPRTAAPPSTGRIVYDAQDGVARDLAERLVGLAAAADPAAAAILDALFSDRARQTFPRAAGLTGATLAAARQRGDDAGYIMALDRDPLAPCRGLAIMVEGVRWLDPEMIVPLIDTRPQAIVRRERSGVTLEWDGGLLLAGEGE